MGRRLTRLALALGIVLLSVVGLVNLLVAALQAGGNPEREALA